MQSSTLVAVALAGSVGAVTRHLLASWLRLAWPDLPLATAVVNVVGCFGFGFVWALAQGRWSPVWTTAVLVGFFGAFTTFSSFAFDCHELLSARRYGWFVLDLVGQNALGLAALVGGMVLGEMIASA